MTRSSERLGTDETGPVQICLWRNLCGRCRPASTTTPKAIRTPASIIAGLAQPVIGPRAKVRMKFANGTELRLELDGDWGPVWERSSSATKERSKSIETRSPAIRRIWSSLLRIPAPIKNSRRNITSRIGSTASRRVGDARPTSSTGNDHQRCAISSTLLVISARWERS